MRRTIIDDFYDQYETEYSYDEVRNIINSYYSSVYKELNSVNLNNVRIKYLGNYKIFPSTVKRNIEKLKKSIDKFGPREQEINKLKTLEEYERRNNEAGNRT